MNLKEKRILIVDDIAKNLQLLGNILKQEEIKIEFALNGQAAIEWVNKSKFDLILLDIMMPEISGFQVCEHIRKDKKFDDIPIIFLTAKTDSESVLKGFELGAQDYVTKPFDSRELLARVNTHLELKDSRDKLKSMNTILDEKVKQRTHELKVANEQLLKLDEAKSSFLNIISHEIRTPLNGIMGGIDLMNEIELSEEATEFLDLLNTSANRLEQFSLKALDISLFNSKGEKALRKEPCFLEMFAELMIEKLGHPLKSKNLKVELTCTSSEMVEADTMNITKVFKYILENAIEFSPENEEINIDIWKNEASIHAKISDKGKGFDPHISITNILPFSSNNHVDQNPGLSLFLCKQIIEAHGGKIWNGNNEGKGAFVEFKLPISFQFSVS